MSFAASIAKVADVRVSFSLLFNAWLTLSTVDRCGRHRLKKSSFPGGLESAKPLLNYQFSGNYFRNNFVSLSSACGSPGSSPYASALTGKGSQ